MPHLTALAPAVRPFDLDDVREADILADLPGVYCVARLHMTDGRTYAEVTFGPGMEAEDFAAIGALLPPYRFAEAIGDTHVLGTPGVTVRYLLTD